MYLAARVTKNINFSQFQTLPSIVEIVALLVPTYPFLFAVYKPLVQYIDTVQVHRTTNRSF